MTNQIKINGDQLRVVFSRYDLDGYRLFLRTKLLPEYHLDYDWKRNEYTLTAPARLAPMMGLEPVNTERESLPLAGHLFDYQAFIVRTALEARRYAVWADTGLGKTAIFLEWARQVAHRTGGRVLIVSPLNIIPQTAGEAAKFYGDALPLERIHTKADMRQWCRLPGQGIGITNYEKFIPARGEEEVVSELRYCAGLVLDESSILKSGGGTIKWALIKSARGIQYKLSCTATPAPNDTMEYASQASFLEKLRNEGEILWTYFKRDKSGEWKVKEHARPAFYRFMAGWSVYLRQPARYGFADNLKGLPAPDFRRYNLAVTPEQRAAVSHVPDDDGQIQMFAAPKVGITQRSKWSQIAKGFIYADGRTERIDSVKPGFVADLVRQDVSDGLQVLVWTVFDAESEIICEELARRGIEHQSISGKDSTDTRAERLENFRTGKIQVLVSKASLLGYGMNFQHCGSMVFSGFDDSYERFYQAVRRAYRYGQTRSVRVHIPIVTDLEGVIWKNIEEKAARFDTDTAAMEANYIQAMAEVLPGLRKAE